MKALFILPVLALAACAPAPVALDGRAAWCAHSEPRDLSVAVIDAMTPEARRKEETYHQRGVEWCGWPA